MDRNPLATACNAAFLAPGTLPVPDAAAAHLRTLVPVSPRSRLPLVTHHPPTRFRIRAALQPEPLWFEAARTGDLATLTHLIRSSTIADPSTRQPATGRTAVHLAAQSGHVDLLPALFELARGVGGAQPHFRHYPERSAALFAAVDTQGRTALHYAADAGPEAVRVAHTLVTFGTPVHLRDAAGLSALDCARRAANQPLVDCLTRLPPATP